MALVFELTLDTTAPRVEWGAVTGTIAGDLLRVAYTADEDGIVDATLALPDGRELGATILADRIEVHLPPDTPSGAATLTAYVSDDLGNEDVLEYTIVVSGAIAAGPSGVGRASHPTWSPPIPDWRLVTSTTSRAGTRSRDRLTAVPFSPPARLRASSATAVSRRVPPWQDRVVATSSSRVDVGISTSTATAGTATDGRVVRRRDGRAIEEALLLDLL